ncbi:GNAT family N-acetyltransferase [uncultured Cohaesibacter sp.]|uniref:GNAT family N-acetyltransferase n=1 Tax=uncultured Cohaesibacter sp. TaxID=1002546 RepID=UPI00292F935F|nr:GNAT family N-acetyltransferase [uncultured Cohaesibacter sp.]
MRMPSLKSDRLVLRPLLPKDVPAIEDHLSNYDVSCYLGRVPHPYAKGNAIEWIEAQSRGTVGINMAITQNDTLIGTVGLKASTEKDIGVFAPTIGYWLGAPFWGKGIMKEAVRCLLEWYLPKEPTERICASVMEKNARSLNVLTKLGFAETGKGAIYSKILDRDVPAIFLELTAQRYYETIR